ncbi:hypothetical protein GGI20_000549 [Coemansia sp. BCRC 34301]|nr:hypothetical protein GGI20_000549 [Coemansia sp. BCRC 34301]
MEPAADTCPAKVHALGEQITFVRYWVQTLGKLTALSWFAFLVLAFVVKHLRMPPKLYLTGVHKTKLCDVRFEHQTIEFSLPLKITVYNPNYASVFIRQVEIAGRLAGSTQNIFVTTANDITLARRDNTTFVHEIDFKYDIMTDEGMAVFGDLLEKCKSQPESPPLVIDYSLLARYSALGFGGVLRQNETVYLVCPLNMMHVTLQGSLDSIHRHSSRILAGSLDLAAQAIDASVHALGKSFGILRMFHGYT